MRSLIESKEEPATATTTVNHNNTRMASQESQDILAEFTAPCQDGFLVKAVLGGRYNSKGNSQFRHSGSVLETTSFVERHSSASSLQDLDVSIMDDETSLPDLESGVTSEEETAQNASVRKSSFHKRMSSTSRFPWEQRGDFLEQAEEARLQEELTEKESQGIFRLRLLVLTILFLTTISVSVIVYVVTTKGEKDAFKTQYEGAAAKVIESFSDIIEEMGSVSGLGVANSAHSVDHKSEWPFVTLSNFRQRAGNARHLSGALLVSISPLVTQENLAKWEEFVQDPLNNFWVDAGHDFQQQLGIDNFEYLPNIERSILHQNRTIDPVHYFDSSGLPHVESTNFEEFLPVWQSSPVLKTRYINENLKTKNIHENQLSGKDDDSRNTTSFSRSYLGGMLDKVIFQEESAFVGGFDMAPPGTVRHENPTTARFATLMSIAAGKEVEYLGDPMANFYIPIFDLFDQSSRKAVAVMTSTIHWRNYFGKILPSNIKGIDVILENTCHGSYSYRISGGEASPVGFGDKHDRAFEEWERSGSFQSSTIQDGTINGIQLHQEGCDYKVHVYPSKEFYHTYDTPTPIIITCSIIAVFLFTIANFLIYDRLVERRQTIIMNAAIKSTVHVSKLEETVRKRTVKLEKSNQRLERANRTVTLASGKRLQHFACMSHEIRTPLNCIIGISSLLREEDLKPKQKESLGMIVSSGELLLRVVNDVLDYSKLESGKVEVELQTCNLQEALDCVVRSVETNAQSKNISVETRYGLTVNKFLRSDSRRLQQILYNLLGNAIKFSKEDGKVELVVDHHTLITTGDDETPAVGILRMTIKDYGKGIEKEDFEKIFEPFSQASTETERLYGGTGLGLSISAKIVKALGGQISVESEVGKWTAMHVDFPHSDNTITLADIPKLAPHLRNVVLFLVGADQEELWEVSRVFKPCVAKIVAIDSMSELKIHAASLDGRHDYITLVNENCYDKQICQELATGKRMLFVTLGPKFCVKDAREHIRQISRVLPSILIQELDDLLVKSKETNNGIAPPIENDPADKVIPFEDFRILIAEDNLVNQKVLARVLKRIGVKDIQVVENGKLAVDKEAAEEFDVVLMDMQMPIMDGIEACRLIVDRQNREGITNGAKVVFCTAHVLDSFKNECYASGGSGFLPKPFRIDDVKKCLQETGHRH